MINIIEEFRQHKNEENAEKQAAYLRHQFEFIGLKKGTVTITFECKNLETSDAIKQEKVTLVVDKKLNIKKK